MTRRLEILGRIPQYWRQLLSLGRDCDARLNAYYRHWQESALASRPERRRPRNVPGVDVPAFELPGELADADTIGIIYDEIDGLNFYNEYGMLRDLFADPALTADQAILGRAVRVSGSDTIGRCRSVA